MRTLTLFVLALSVVAAQTAKVVTISAGDSNKLEAAAEAKRKAEAAYDAEVKRVESKYLAVGDRDKDRSGSLYFGEGNTLTITTSAGSLVSYSIGGPQPDPKVEPCYYSQYSVACLEKQLAEAHAKEAAGTKPEPTPHYRYWRSGFENGYEFAEGFRFVVPKPKVHESSPRLWNNGLYYNPYAGVVTQP